MSLELEVKTASKIYVHEPLPAIIINNSLKYKDDSTTLIENEITWRINGYLVPENGSIRDQVAELEAIYEPGLLTSVRLQDGSIVIEQIPTEKGIQVISLNFPEGDGPEWATRRKYEIELQGTDVVSTVISSGEYDYTISYATEQSGIVTRTIAGSLRDVAGNAAYTKYTTLKTAQGWATWTDANLISDNYTQNDLNTKVDFTIVHRKYWTVYSSGLTGSDVSVETVTDNQNVIRTRISGWFEGSAINCNSAIVALIPYYDIIIDSKVTRNDFTNRTSFSYNCISTLSNDILYHSQTITIEASVRSFIHKMVLGGYAPIRQTLGWTPGRAVQSGVIKRLNYDPVVPFPHWDLFYVKSQKVSRVSSEYNTQRGCYVYSLSYEYNFEFDVTPTFTR